MAETSSPFERAGDPGAPLPVVFGSDVLIAPPSIHSHGAQDTDTSLDGLTNAFDLQMAVALFILGGICERHPDLRVAFLEGTGGWIVPMIEPRPPARLAPPRITAVTAWNSSPTAAFPEPCPGTTL